jgi:acyl-CoA thioester hydrolase
VTEERFTVQLRWSDGDALGHVNHARYLTYFEDARMSLVAQSPLGVPGGSGARGYIAARIAVDYRRPVLFSAGLTVTVASAVERIGTSSVTLRQQLLLPGRPEPATEAECVLVAYDYAISGSRPLDDDERAFWAGYTPGGR